MRITYAMIALGGLMVAGCGGSGGSGGPVPNAAPVVSAIQDQTITANEAAAPIEFSVGDDTTSAGELDVAAMTIDQAVVADDIQVDGNGAERALIVTPVVDEIGTAVISVMVTDEEGLSDAASFTLTVEPQTRGISEFARNSFADSDEGDPALINAVVFDQDAEDDEFDDLLN